MNYELKTINIMMILFCLLRIYNGLVIK